MTDETYDWGDLQGEIVDRMTEPKIVPVPAEIVAQAQRSVDNTRLPDGKVVKAEGPVQWGRTLVIQKQFPNDGMAAAFAKLMSKAGSHTTPKSFVTVKVDPRKEGNKSLVRWQAGKPRGRAPKV